MVNEVVAGIERNKKIIKGTKTASAKWLQRQWKDPYVAKAQRERFRSRAAYKLQELNKKYGLISKGSVVLDLGAAPGGWTQIAVEAVKTDTSDGQVIAVDILPIQEIHGAQIIVGDFRQHTVRQRIDTILKDRSFDAVLSDMAPNFSGNSYSDTQKQLGLCHNALSMARLYLRPGGHFVTKVLQCEDLKAFQSEVAKHFEFVKWVKPAASRTESTEMYIVAKCFRGSSCN